MCLAWSISDRGGRSGLGHPPPVFTPRRYFRKRAERLGGNYGAQQRLTVPGIERAFCPYLHAIVIFHRTKEPALGLLPARKLARLGCHSLLTAVVQSHRLRSLSGLGFAPARATQDHKKTGVASQSSNQAVNNWGVVSSWGMTARRSHVPPNSGSHRS